MSTSAWKNYHPLLLNLLVQAIFGGYSVFTSAALTKSTISPLVFAFIRDATAAVQLLAIAYLASHRSADKDGKRQPFMPQKADWAHFILTGLFGVWGTQGMSALALANVPPAYLSLMTPLQPVAALVFALILGLEGFNRGRWMSWAKIFGIFVAVAGAVALVALSHADSGGGLSIMAQSKNFAAGSFFIALQVMSAGAYAVCQKPLLDRYPSIVVAAWGYALGSVILLLSVITCASDPAAWAISSPMVAASLVYASVFCSVFNYGSMAYINAVSSPVMLTAFNPLQGLFAALFASIFLGEAIGLPEIVGGALISAGLLTTVLAKLAEQREGAHKRLDDDEDGEQEDKGELLLELRS